MTLTDVLDQYESPHFKKVLLWRGETRMPTLSMNLSEHAFTVLKQAAAERRQSVEVLVQDALDSFLPLAMAGGVNDAPDLASAVAERWDKIRREALAWRTLSEETRRRYGADFVAVHNGEVLDHDRDRVALHQRIRRRFGDLPILITLAQAPAPREFTVRSPRLERIV